MAVPITTARDVTDKAGQPVRVGSKVRVAGITEPVEVHETDPRYDVLVILIPGRAGQRMGQMVRASEVELA